MGRSPVPTPLPKKKSELVFHIASEAALTRAQAERAPDIGRVRHAMFVEFVRTS